MVPLEGAASPCLMDTVMGMGCPTMVVPCIITCLVVVLEDVDSVIPDGIMPGCGAANIVIDEDDEGVAYMEEEEDVCWAGLVVMTIPVMGC